MDALDVPRAYDLIAEKFFADRTRPTAREQIPRSYALQNLPVGAAVLDLGCGTGRPLAEELMAWAMR